MKNLIQKPQFWHGLTLATINLALAGLLAWAYLSFGSIQAALSYANGNSLIADSRSRSLGVVESGGEVPLTFSIGNYSDHTIDLLGAKTSCSCVATDGLPATIPPHSRKDLAVRVRVPARPGEFHEDIRLYSNAYSQPETVLKIDGFARGGPPNAATPAATGRPIPSPINLIRKEASARS